MEWKGEEKGENTGHIINRLRKKEGEKEEKQLGIISPKDYINNWERVSPLSLSI